MKKISVLIPVYNEEESCKELYAQLVKVFHSPAMKTWKYEILFVNDGSRDRTGEVLNLLRKKDKNVRVLSFYKNNGKAAALSVGFREASGDLLITMDGDLQDDPAEIPHLIKKINDGYDLVSGWKFRRHDPVTKTFPSWVWNLFLRMASRIKIHDFNCGLKIYKKEVYKNVELYGSMHRFIPALAGWMGFRIGELKINHRKRKYGHSKYGFARFFKGTFDFFTVFFLNKYLRTPLHLFGTLSIIFSAAGLVISGYVFYLKILTGTIQGRMPLFLGGIFLIIMAVQFFSMGLLGELIVKNSQKKGDYVVKKD